MWLDTVTPFFKRLIRESMRRFSSLFVVLQAQLYSHSSRTLCVYVITKKKWEVPMWKNGSRSWRMLLMIFYFCDSFSILFVRLVRFVLLICRTFACLYVHGWLWQGWKGRYWTIEASGSHLTASNLSDSFLSFVDMRFAGGHMNQGDVMTWHVNEFINVKLFVNI